MDSDGIKLTPYGEKILKDYKQKLEPLLRKYPDIAYSFHNKNLSQSITKILVKMGFKVHSTVAQTTGTLSKHIPIWLKADDLVLLHYRPETGSMNLIHLLRAIKANNKKLSYKNLIPVFFANFSSNKQMEVFRILGAFGISHALFLTPDVPLERNVEELMMGLVNYINPHKPQEQKAIDLKADVGNDENVEKRKRISEYDIYSNKGKELMQLGKLEDAIKQFSRAIEMQPDYKSLISRGDAFYKMEKYSSALIDYQQASRIERSVPDPYANIGACCFKLVKEAAQHGNKALAQQWVKRGLASMQEAKVKVDELIKSKENSPEEMPEHPYERIIKALGETDIRGLGMKEEENIINELTAKALDSAGDIDYLDPSVNMETRINYAILKTRSKDYDTAEAIFRKVVEEDPSIAGPAFNNFAVELRKNGQNGKSFQIYAELLEKEDVPDRKIIVENLKTAGLKYAVELRDDLKNKEAVKVYKTILSHKPKEMEWVLCELATAYHEIPDQAQATLRLVEALYLNKELVHDERFKRYGSLVRLIQEAILKLSEAT